MPVNFDFLFGINRRYGILTVLNSGERRFDNHVTHARRILPSGQLTLINLYIDMQIVVANQHRRRCRGRSVVTNELVMVYQMTDVAIG